MLLLIMSTLKMKKPRIFHLGFFWDQTSNRLQTVLYNMEAPLSKRSVTSRDWLTYISPKINCSKFQQYFYKSSADLLPVTKSGLVYFSRFNFPRQNGHRHFFFNGQTRLQSSQIYHIIFFILLAAILYIFPNLYL